MAVIANTLLKAGFMGVKSKSYTLVLTNKRVIFAHLTAEMMKDLVRNARDSAKADGKGFFGQWGAQLGAYSEFASHYLEMPPEEVLAQTPQNFAIDRAIITKVKVKSTSADADGVNTIDRLIIKTTDKNKYVVTLNGGVSSAKKALIAAEMI